MEAGRWKQIGAIVFPVVIALLLFQRAFRIWFLNDDFAWLGLGLSVKDWGTLAEALFTPMAQGTVRTLSERLFFLGFERWFGWESLPMRIWAFGTLAVAQSFVVLLVQRMTGQWWAGPLAAVLWSLNFGLTVAVCWLSSYNQILLSALALATLYGFARGVAGEGRRWMVFSWICYGLAFGALETVVVIPAVLLGWAWLFNRDRWRSSLPYAVPAVVFAAWHLFGIDKPETGATYRMYWDGALFETVWLYWRWFLGAAKLPDFDPAYTRGALAAEWVLTIGLIGFALWRLKQKDRAVAFGLLLSGLLLAPVLPLREHRTDYYLASGSVGLAMVLALAPFRLTGMWRWVGWGLVGIYALASYTAQQATVEWYLGRSGPLRPMMRGMLRASQLHPDKLIVVEGLTAEMRASAVGDGALRLIPGQRVYLEPGAGLGELGEAAARRAFEEGRVVVYRFEGDRLRDVTREWEQGRALLLRDAR
jgi:hypothetical protein